jgi:hypothetical protein
MLHQVNFPLFGRSYCKFGRDRHTLTDRCSEGCLFFPVNRRDGNQESVVTLFDIAFQNLLTRLLNNEFARFVCFAANYDLLAHTIALFEQYGSIFEQYFILNPGLTEGNLDNKKAKNGNCKYRSQ